jgi:mxaA protein
VLAFACNAAAWAEPPASAPVTAAPPAWPVAQVEQPRGFGHFVGDRLTQRVLLESAGQPVRLAGLPPVAHIGVWLERQASRIEPDALGRDWLVVQYQLLNAPQAPTRVQLPALALAGAGASTSLQVPAWPIDVAPLVARASIDGIDSRSLRPDRPAPLRDTALLLQRLRVSMAGLAAVAVAWLGWWLWRNRRERQRQPFAMALQALRRLDDDSPAAWQTLHHAIDLTAGRVTRSTSLPALFDARPQFAPLRPQLEAFYAQSAVRFFGEAASAVSSTAPAAIAIAPRQLCRALRRIELRHAG